MSWRRDGAVAAGLFLAGLGLRLHDLGRDPVWLDEANTVLIALRSPAGIVQALTRDGHPPLYYLLLHGWMALLGDGATSIRWLSALLGALLAPALALLGRPMAGTVGALVAALLALVWPLHVHYSQQARMYALLPVLSLALVAALWRVLDRGEAARPRDWALVGVAALALVWTHNYGMFLVAAAPLAWLLRGPRRRGVARALALTLGAVAVVDLLWLPVVLRQAASGVGAWIAGLFVGRTALIHSLLLVGAGFDHPPYLHALGGPSPVAALSMVWLEVAVLGAGVLLWRDPRRRGDTLALAALGLAPIVLPYAVSLAWMPIFLVGRYEIVGYPALALVLGAGAESAWRRSTARAWAAAGIGLLLVAYLALAAVTLAHRFRERPVERTEAAVAEAVAGHAARGDVVIVTGLARAPLEYHLGRLGWRGKVRIESFPREIGEHLGWYDAVAMARRADRYRVEASELLQRLQVQGGAVLLVDHVDSQEMVTIQTPLRRLLDAQAARATTLVRVPPELGAGIYAWEVTHYRLRP